MYLKKVELHGFKSFADKTEFEFVPGITGVVGPNGSGKSNITDAIRWVLGEQSAKTLRGSRMEDVIFAGSDSRKAINYCEVSLTLDNSNRDLDIEYYEVAVTRRLYRSGESEYFINKQLCRLKDITELFMDTGLGKESFSIIGQGKIEEILSSKSEDRRGIFEEAAGIVKYKARKKEAEKKLEETEQNIVRINDLIFELYDQIEPLEKQAVIATKYMEYKEQLKELTIQLYVHDIEKTYEEWQQVEQLQKEWSNEQLEHISRVQQSDALIQKRRWNVNQLEKELDEINKQLLDISQKVEQSEGKRDVLKEREKNHHTLKSQTIQAIDKLLEKKTELQTQLTMEKEKLAEIDSKITLTKDRLNVEEKNLSEIMTNHEGEIEDLKAEYFECVNEMATLRNEIRHSNQLKESLTIRIEKFKAEIQSVEKETVVILEKKNNTENEITHLQKIIEEEKETYREKIHTHRELTELLQEKESNYRKQEQIIDSLIAKKELLNELQSDYSGFNQGVKEILRERKKGTIQGIHGAVAELIQVPKDYETAIEVSLGGSLQHLVVDSESVGREAINLLKQRKIGRATFLPLSVIKGKEFSVYDLKKIQHVKGFIGIAADLVKVTDNYRPILEYLLGQVLIASDLKTANELAGLLGYRTRIVTLDGDIVSPGGSMTGGSFQKKQTSLLSRQREIEEITTQIERIRQANNKEKVIIEKTDLKLRAIQAELENLRNKGENSRLKLQEYQGKQQQFEYEFKNISERAKGLSTEIEQLNGEFKQLINTETELNTNLVKKQEVEQEIQKKIEIAESIRTKDNSSKENKQQSITDLKIDLARLLQERDGLSSLIERLTKELDQFVYEIEQHQVSLIEMEQELTNQKLDEQSISGNISELRAKKVSIQETIKEKRDIRFKTINEIDKEEIETKEIRKKLKIAESELHKSEVRLNRLDVELEKLLTQLAEEYEISYEWARKHHMLVNDINLTRQQVNNLKTEIDKLGNVNIGAIDEYARVSERYQFLSTQKEDLTEAKETLYQVINEIEKEMSIQFKQSFDGIKEQFQIIFTKLFGGGRADLILSNPDDLLETGIDIVAQPPGKKLQHLTLLSGGEKALTAITLLFAILRVKPVPFCVLDEVEAALDEANVHRFADYLKEFSALTQFIVVTHRKGTMEGADVLYGVTMQEHGVSRLVSVKLDEKERASQTA